MRSQPTEAFVGFSGLLLIAGVLTIPVLGGHGIIAVLVTLYFCLVLLNGAASGRR